MQTKDLRKVPMAAKYERLAALLELEESHYRRLLRLAWRQNSYMKRQDVVRLDANSGDWAVHLPPADRARIERERHVAALAAELGISVPPGHIGDLLDYVDPETKQRIQAMVTRLRGTAGRLARQNALNRNLAEFCLDLAHEESQIFKKCLLEDPAGCYGGDARATDRGPGGFLVKQA